MGILQLSLIKPSWSTSTRSGEGRCGEVGGGVVKVN